MKKYRININTNKIVEDNGNLGQFFFMEDWREATTNEVNANLLKIAQEKKIAELKINRTAYKKTIQINSDYTYWDCDVTNNIYNFNNIMNCICGWTAEERALFIEKTELISSIYDSKKELINEATISTIESISTSFVE